VVSRENGEKNKTGFFKAYSVKSKMALKIYE
jgi:hypothetical protein